MVDFTTLHPFDFDRNLFNFVLCDNKCSQRVSVHDNDQASQKVCYIALLLERVRPELVFNVEHMEQIVGEALYFFEDSDKGSVSVELVREGEEVLKEEEELVLEEEQE